MRLGLWNRLAFVIAGRTGKRPAKSTIGNSAAGIATDVARDGRAIAARRCALLLAGCDRSDEVPGYEDMVSQVEGGKIGRNSDQWIELRNLAGEWERTGLIFGYVDDYDECMKAVAGLKKVNYAREYRCVPANQ